MDPCFPQIRSALRCTRGLLLLCIRGMIDRVATSLRGDPTFSSDHSVHLAAAALLERALCGL